jgi:hypothetical protein
MVELFKVPLDHSFPCFAFFFFILAILLLALLPALSQLAQWWTMSSPAELE